MKILAGLLVSAGLMILPGAGYAQTPGWTVLPRMPHYHLTGAAVVAKSAVSPNTDDRIYVLGGWDGNPVATVDVFDGTTWNESGTVPNLLSGRNGLAAVTASDGTVWVLGGFTGSYIATAAVDYYKPGGALHAWTPAASMPVGVGEAGAVVAKDHDGVECIFVFGGLQDSQNTVYTSAVRDLWWVLR